MPGAACRAGRLASRSTRLTSRAGWRTRSSRWVGGRRCGARHLSSLAPEGPCGQQPQKLLRNSLSVAAGGLRMCQPPSSLPLGACLAPAGSGLGVASGGGGARPAARAAGSRRARGRGAPAALRRAVCFSCLVLVLPRCMCLRPACMCRRSEQPRCCTCWSCLPALLLLAVGSPVHRPCTSCHLQAVSMQKAYRQLQDKAAELAVRLEEARREVADANAQLAVSQSRVQLVERRGLARCRRPRMPRPCSRTTAGCRASCGRRRRRRRRWRRRRRRRRRRPPPRGQSWPRCRTARACWRRPGRRRQRWERRWALGAPGLLSRSFFARHV